MRRITLCLGLALLLGWAAPALAGICFIDSVPAATLLLPYFEVDLNNPNGLTTLFSVNNAAKGGRLAHVTIWTDLAVPVFDFNVYLTGYDVQSVNLRDIIVNGNLPQTASVGQDPNDTISPKGPYSKDKDFPSCQGQLPPPNIGTLFTAHLQAALTGQPSNIFGGLCAGQNLGDNIARGYVTMDAVSNCTLRFPSDPGYFGSGGTGDATNDNVLWGDWTIVNSAQSFAEGGALVHIEADSVNQATSTPGNYTFYGRYDSFSASDNREPLATEFVTRFLNGGPFSGGTTLLVWRDPKVAQQPFACPAVPGTRPPWYALGEEGILIFDEQERAASPIQRPFSPQAGSPGLIPFPAATQRTRVGSAALPTPFNFGFFFLDLNTTVGPASTLPPFDPSVAQAYVYTTLESNGRFAVGIEGIKLDSACFPPGHGLPTPQP